MKKIYRPEQEITVPDGTIVASLFSNNDVSNDFMDKLSLAKGKIKAGVSSKIHIHPVVTQVTYVLKGGLDVMMKSDKDHKPYRLSLEQNNTVVTEPLAYFQLINNSEHDCEVLYMVTPAFLFEVDEQGSVIYNDAIILEVSWQDLEKNNWELPAPNPEIEKFTLLRQMAKERFKVKK